MGLIGVGDAARILGVTRQAVVLRIQAGQLPAKRISGVYVLHSDVVEMFKQHALRKPQNRKE